MGEDWERSSVRLSYKNEGNQPIVTDSNDFYPFGMNFIRNEEENAVFGAGSYFNYKYNGKELQETGMYDYGWRQYMSDVGRWYGMDQLSEKFHYASPYAYVLNNPLSFIDPDGRDVEPTADGWKFTDGDMQLLIRYLQQGNSLKPMVKSLAETTHLQIISTTQGSALSGHHLAVAEVVVQVGAVYL